MNRDTAQIEVGGRTEDFEIVYFVKDMPITFLPAILKLPETIPYGNIFLIPQQ
jgi:hypothetical protein